MSIKISVLLPIYRTRIEWVESSINSILNQNYKEFECILINDDPEDKILAEYLIKKSRTDSRIVLIENEKNLGLPISLNKGLTESKGEFIVRMDADDLCELDRLEKQISFMVSNPKVSLCGAQAYKIHPNEEIISKSTNPTDPKIIKRLAKYRNPTTHATWIAKKEDIISCGMYRNVVYAEDYDLLLRLLFLNKLVVNLPDIVLRYRVHKHSSSVKGYLDQKYAIVYLSKAYREGNIFEIQPQNLSQKITPTVPYLYLARSRGASSHLLKSYFLFRAYFSTSIERSYLNNIVMSRIVRLFNY